MVETETTDDPTLTPCCGADLAMEEGCFTCDGPTVIDEDGEARCRTHLQPLVSIEGEDSEPECPDCYHGGGMASLTWTVWSA